MQYLKNYSKLDTCCIIGGCSVKKIVVQEDASCYELIKSRTKNNIIDLVENSHVSHFLGGMNIGFEQYAAEAVIELKEKYPQLTLEGILPYENHSINWTGGQRNKYYSIMNKIDREVLLQYHYTDDCMKKRNQYMINKSKYIIFFGEGTSCLDNLIEYARTKGRIVINMDYDESVFPRKEYIFNINFNKH